MVVYDTLSSLSDLAPATPLQALITAAVAPFALVFGVLLLIAVRYTVRLTFNVVTDHFALGRYGKLPRPQHKGTWLQMLNGDMSRILQKEPGEGHWEFVQEAGSNVLVYRVLFWAPRLLLVDVGAMLHILGAQQSYSFPKPEFTRRFLTRSIGDGLLVVEGAKHKSQRKILQPAFSTSAVRDLMPSFFWHAKRLTDRLGLAVDASQDPNNTSAFLGQKKINGKLSDVFDVSAWVARCTLDVIGDTGFDWQFDCILKDDADRVNTVRNSDRLSDAFQQILIPFRPNPLEIALIVIRSQPFLNWLHCIRLPIEAKMDRNMAVIKEMSQEIIDHKRAQIADLMDGNEKGMLSKADWEDGSSATGGKDLLFRMMRSNMSHDLTDSERMTDDELLGQMTTLLLAGHETTSTLLSWTLLMLAKHPAAQASLRKELQTYVNESGREELSYDDLAQLPYLDSVIKETLRMRSPVPSTIRQANHETVVPLSKPYINRDGTGYIDHIVMHKGEEIVLPLLLINTSEQLWGPDAKSFRPEQWFDIPEAAKKSGMPLHLMSFISGPRACIGNRFALAEAKAILFSLIIKFQFSPVEDWEIEGKQAVVMRSRVKGKESDGFQLPLHVRRAPSSQ